MESLQPEELLDIMILIMLVPSVVSIAQIGLGTSDPQLTASRPIPRDAGRRGIYAHKCCLRLDRPRQLHSRLHDGHRLEHMESIDCSEGDQPWSTGVVIDRRMDDERRHS